MPFDSLRVGSIFTIGLLCVIMVVISTMMSFRRVSLSIRAYKEMVTVALQFGANSLVQWVESSADLGLSVATHASIIAFLEDPNNELKAQAAALFITNVIPISHSISSIALALPENPDLLRISESSIQAPHLPVFPASSKIEVSDYYQAIFQNNYPYFIGRVEHHPVASLPLAHAIHNAQGEVIGMVVLFLNLQSINQMIDRMHTGRSGSTFFIDDQSNLLSPPRLMPSQYEPVSPIITRVLAATPDLLHIITSGGHDVLVMSHIIADFAPARYPLYAVYTQRLDEVLNPVVLDFVGRDLLTMFMFMVMSALALSILHHYEKAVHEVEKFTLETKHTNLRRLSIIDGLTGLYNRTFFREERTRIDKQPADIGLLIIDVDGLKLINDAFGHEEGDKIIRLAAKTIKGSLPKESVTRIGGDEFAIFIENCPLDRILKIREKLIENVAMVGQIRTDLLLPLNLSIGIASLKGPNVSNMLFREADITLYTHKSSNATNVRKRALDRLLRHLRIIEPNAHLWENDMETLCIKVASNFDKTLYSENDLKKLIHYHNIGLISRELGQSPDKYAQTGYRIAMFLPEISNIAGLILKHREAYDGRGNLGLCEDNIPLECRIFNPILMLVQNYFYSHNLETAINEIESLSGSVFDPAIINHLVPLARDFYTMQKDPL